MNRTPSTKKTGKRERETDSRVQSARGQIIQIMTNNIRKIADGERNRQALQTISNQYNRFFN